MGVAAEPVVAEVAEEKPKRADKSKATPLADLVEGNEYAGKITGLAAYGAFVDIGAQSDGLVHISSSRSYADDAASVVKEGDDVTPPTSRPSSAGDEVKVRIIDVDLDKATLGLAMNTYRDPTAPPGRDDAGGESAATRCRAEPGRAGGGQRAAPHGPGDDIWENKDSFNWKDEKRGWTPAYVDAIYAMEGALRRANASDSPTIQRGAWQHDRAVGEHFSSRDAAKAAGQWRALRDAAAALRYPARCSAPASRSPGAASPRLAAAAFGDAKTALFEGTHESGRRF
ncbi:hypothetical protein JL722_15225 [Aureococcus anophagefferens]|nr:hypothetical protein JL722_15225 [Aureococcus anophagefferens]